MLLGASLAPSFCAIRMTPRQSGSRLRARIRPSKPRWVNFTPFRSARMARDSQPGLKAQIQSGKSLIGSYVTFPSPDVVELFAHAGMDYVIIDLQHASPDWQTLAHMLRAADAGGTASIVR